MMMDDIASCVAKEMDKRLEEAFALCGLNIEQIKLLIDCGRLECYCGGLPPAITYRAILDSEVLFCLSMKTETDMQAGKVAIKWEYLSPPKQLGGMLNSEE